MIFSAVVRSIWYSLSDSVWHGATTMRVARVHAHRVEVLHVADGDAGVGASRITSYSSSFQPSRERSTSTWWIGQAARPAATMRSYCSAVCAKPPPVPPSV